MDETGLILSKLLLFDYLTPYLALADALGLSVNAVHKRIQSMVEESVIRGFTTKFSLSRAYVKLLFSISLLPIGCSPRGIQHAPIRPQTGAKWLRLQAPSIARTTTANGSARPRGDSYA